MTVLVSYLCLFCAVTGAFAEDRQACSTTMDGTCAMEEGLEMLQSKATKVTVHGETSIDKAGKEKAVEKTNKTNSSHDANKSHVRGEYEFERPLLDESDIEKIRFRARHQDWIDILELYKDGFLKRYHAHDAGTWHLNKDNQLIFNWLKWGAEQAAMQSTDHGKTFNSTGKTKFELKSYVQPLWWRTQFDGSNVAYLQEQAKKKNKKEIFADTKEIIRAHASGRKADLDEEGYLAVAMLKDDDEMRDFIHRLADSMNLQIMKEGGVSGLLPYYSGSSSYQTLHKLKDELLKGANKKKGVRWILHDDDPELALLQVPQESGWSLLQEQAVETEHEKEEKVLDKSSKNSSKDAKPHYEEIELEKDLLEESDIEKIRFRAKHDDWMDILDLYKDGFFKRYHDGDLGVWHQNKKNQLVLKWLKWGEEELQSSDDGKSFLGGGKGQFSLKSYKQPVWWRRNFDASSDSELQELSHESKTSHKSKSIKSHTDDMMAIIGNHVNGKMADLNERGYELVALQKKPEEMKRFIKRVVQSMNMDITNEGGLNGIVPYYSGEITYQTLAKLKDEIMTTARRPEGARWVMDQGGDDPSRAAL